jgi:hypothetical protein
VQVQDRFQGPTLRELPLLQTEQLVYPRLALTIVLIGVEASIYSRRWSVLVLFSFVQDLY